MPLGSRLKSFLPRLLANWITLLGTIIATVSGLAILVLVLVGIATSRANPYLSLFAIILLPAILLVGLVLIPVGLWVDRRRGRLPGDAMQVAYQTVMSDRSARRRLFFVAFATVANIGIFALAGQRTISYMDSAKFCGTACHVVMQPEWDAWNRSPHSNVACVECHIGPGIAGMSQAKWNGIHQLWGVVTSRYNRPTFAGTKHLLPAKETCETCHSPTRFWPDRIKVFAHYTPDKDNTPKFNALLLRIGGLNPKSQRYEGIHSHASPDRQIQFEYFDDERTKVGKVQVFSKGQLVAEYLPKDAGQKPLGVRSMDCIDCHNRATHIFLETPAKAVDRALYAGALDPKMPFIAQLSAELLARTDQPREGAEARFRAALAAAYQQKHPEVKADPSALANAGSVLARLYLNNVYPAMNLGWNKHRSNLGHKAEGLENPGCFRCHDGEHVAALADGKKKKLSQDCDLCHTGLAFDEDPEKFDDTLSAMLPAAN
ncbi:MAG TPA: NapC/NirT family cytochrome c [Myxococcales bacterium]|nr:NapC/NirT family cytochrome c [Myxococcales bacterium]